MKEFEVVERKITNPKHQITNKHKAPMTKTKKGNLKGFLFRTLEFRTWNLFGICDLELGILSLTRTI